MALDSQKLSAVGYKFLLQREGRPKPRAFRIFPHLPQKHAQTELPTARPYPLETGGARPPPAAASPSPHGGHAGAAGPAAAQGGLCCMKAERYAAGIKKPATRCASGAGPAAPRRLKGTEEPAAGLSGASRGPAP